MSKKEIEKAIKVSHELEDYVKAVSEIGNNNALVIHNFSDRIKPYLDKNEYNRDLYNIMKNCINKNIIMSDKYENFFKIDNDLFTCKGVMLKYDKDKEEEALKEFAHKLDMLDLASGGFRACTDICLAIDIEGNRRMMFTYLAFISIDLVEASFMEYLF